MTAKHQVNELSGVPLWQQVADGVVRDIAAGELAVGDAVPGHRDLGEQWGVSAVTAMNALAHLRNKGLISGGRGKSATVLRSPTVMRMSSDRYRRDSGDSPVAADLGNQHRGPAGAVSMEQASVAVAKRLGITEGDSLSRVDYSWSDDMGPYERSTQWEPLALSGGTSAEVPPESGEPTVIARMAQIGHQVTDVREVWSSRMPTAAESAELNLEEGVPVLVAERTHYAGGLPVETANITIRSDRGVVAVDHQVGGGQ